LQGGAREVLTEEKRYVYSKKNAGADLPAWWSGRAAGGSWEPLGIKSAILSYKISTKVGSLV
jgi:hypothetical protein